MPSNVIRGGQIALHRLQMLKQVAKKTLLYSLIIGICTFGWEISKIEQASLIAYRDHIIAYLKSMVGKENSLVELKVHNNTYTLAAKHILSNFYVQDQRTKVHKILQESAFIAAVATCIASGVLGCLFFAVGVRSAGIKHRKGAAIADFKDVKRAIKKAGRSKYYLAKMPYPARGESSHTLIIGATGVGKTVLISELVEQIRSQRGKAIIYDKKGDYIKWFYHPDKDYILNPFDVRSQSWDLLAEITHPAQIKAITESFIPDAHSENKIWNEAARLVFAAILEQLKEKGSANQDLIEAILLQDMHSLEAALAGTPAQGIIDSDSPKTAASVIFTLSTYLSCLKLLGNQKRSMEENKEEEQLDIDETSNFSIRQWMQSAQDSILFIAAPEEIASSVLPLLTAQIEIAITGLLSCGEEDALKWFILDELPTLQKIPSLSKALSTSRSCGGAFVLGTQNIAQLAKIYGTEGAKELSAECNTRCIFRSNDPDTAKWCAANIGEEEIAEYKESLSYGAHQMRDGVNLGLQTRVKQLLLPSEILNLPDLELFLKMKSHMPTVAKLKYSKRAKIAESFVMKEAGFGSGFHLPAQKQIKNEVTSAMTELPQQPGGMNLLSRIQDNCANGASIKQGALLMQKQSKHIENPEKLDISESNQLGKERGGLRNLKPLTNL